jgi:aspartyl-tRNA(Asn)/glutamyl-tRNA(Gln) amidotransferase subunit C
MNITREMLDKIAHLARLEFDEKDAEKMMQDMSAIVNWVEKLKEVDTDGVEPLTTMSQEVNSVRPDEVREHLDRDLALKSAPEPKSGHFSVPKVLE